MAKYVLDNVEFKFHGDPVIGTIIAKINLVSPENVWTLTRIDHMNQMRYTVSIPESRSRQFINKTRALQIIKLFEKSLKIENHENRN